jgi:hypothetical protein
VTRPYLRPLQEDGSSTHEAFLVGRTTDPKQRVWQIVEERADRDEAVVYCENWWICTPLEYFAGASAGPRIAAPFAQSELFRTDEVESVIGKANEGDFVVVRTGGPVDAIVATAFQGLRGGERRTWKVLAVNGDPGYTVYRW